MAGAKQVILVRGGKIARELPWKFFHLAPDGDPKPEPVDLVYFDYPAGKRSTWKGWLWERGKGPPPGKPDEEVKIEPRIHIRTEDRTVDTKHEYPSVLGLYEYVKAQAAESVAALHFFTHGDYDGPILFADSFENVGKLDLDLPRDPNDTEPRRRDFHGSNPLAGVEGSKFVKALSADALLKLWGCNEEYPLRAPLLHYLAAPRGANGDTARNEQLKTYLAQIETTFSYHMTRGLARIVWATAVGWGTNPWEEAGAKYTGRFPPDFKKKEHWWHAPNFGQKHRQFYQDVLKAPLDGARYVGYRTGWFDSARVSVADARTGIPRLRVDSPRDLQDRLG